jgi:uncharacterized protein YcaQ
MIDLTPYQCPFCEIRFSTHDKLEEHWIDDHGFVPTTFSHTSRYWRHFHDPRTECELKLKAIKTYLIEKKMVIYDPYDRYSAQIITHTQGMLLLSKVLEVLEDSEFKEKCEE